MVTCGRSAFTTTGPIVMLGTKWPSITSTCSQSAPAASTAFASSARREKSAERTDGAMMAAGMGGVSAGVRARASLPARLLLQPRASLAGLELGGDLIEADAGGGEHHQPVVDDVGALGGQRIGVVRHRRQRRFHRLLAELLSRAGRPAGQQLGGVGRGGVGPLAGGDHRLQPREDIGEAAHAVAFSVSRTGRPPAAMAAFASPMLTSPKWKMEAASTASAPPSRTAETRSAAPPAPPEAITGTPTADETAFSRGMS